MQRIAFIVFPEFQILDLAPIAAFECANLLAGRTVYTLATLSEHGGLVRSSSGALVDSRPFDATRYDTVIVAGAFDVEPSPPGLLRYLAGSRWTARRVASICSGAFILAEAGLLDERRATTHWAYAQALAQAHPRVTVQPDRIFVKDGPLWTSAGMTAGIDLVLAMIEEDHGVELAKQVARKLVVYHRRIGGQSQFSTLLELEPRSDRIQRVLAHMRANLRATLSVDELAELAHLSPRQFSRAFKAETGESPARAVERLRVEAARALIESGSLSLLAIGRTVGFEDPERMRRAFLRLVGQPPQALRRVARLAA